MYDKEFKEFKAININAYTTQLPSFEHQLNKIKFNEGDCYWFWWNDFKNKVKDLQVKVDKVNKTCKVKEYSFGDRYFDLNNKRFVREVTLTVQENKTGKKVTLKQSAIDCTEYFIPIDDAKLVNNEGVSKELEKQLLELF